MENLENEQVNAEFEIFYRYGYFVGKWVCSEIELNYVRQLNSQIMQNLDGDNEAIAELRISAIHDDLTGLLRRKPFMEKVNERFRKTNRTSDIERVHSILMLDIDDFKQINDEFGHLVGDDCLMHAGLIIKKSIRDETDLACRWGGEEFVVLLEDTDITGAKTVAFKLQKQINDCATLAMIDSKYELLGVSIGIAEYKHGADFFNAFKKADSLLLDAKKQSVQKNRIEADN